MVCDSVGSVHCCKGFSDGLVGFHSARVVARGVCEGFDGGVQAEEVVD